MKRGQMTANSWQQANTALGLIRTGCSTCTDLARYLNISRTRAWQITCKMIEIGWVAQDRGKTGALRLTEEGQRLAPYLTLATERDDGALERMVPRRGSG